MANQDSKPRIGVVTVSDRASAGEYEDRGGPAIEEYLSKTISTAFTKLSKVIPDEQTEIEKTLIELSDDQHCCLIVITGGTGPSIRDVTPEAVAVVCDKMMDGFGEAMRAVSLTKVPTAILSRQNAGIRSNESGGTLMITLPGSPKAIAECLDAVFAAVPYCIDLIGGPYLETDPQQIVAFRPKKK
jgi:molybdopterin adenylyltransferase